MSNRTVTLCAVTCQFAFSLHAQTITFLDQATRTPIPLKQLDVSSLNGLYTVVLETCDMQLTGRVIIQ